MADARKQARLALGEAAMLPLGEAIELMPIGRPDARGWLEERGLIHHLRGRPCVIWGDVLEALRSSSTKQPDEKPRPRLKLEREPL